jgi:hypothetical protein
MIGAPHRGLKSTSKFSLSLRDSKSRKDLGNDKVLSERSLKQQIIPKHHPQASLS